MISQIFAISSNNAIGYKNSLPWPKLKKDMRWFQNKTKNNIVVMGRKTWESLGDFAPLKNRHNVVVSSSLVHNADVITDLIEQNILAYEVAFPSKEVFIMGGAQLYNATLQLAERLYITQVHQDFEADTFLDKEKILTGFKKIYAEDDIDNGINLTFEIYEREKCVNT